MMYKALHTRRNAIWRTALVCVTVAFAPALSAQTVGAGALTDVTNDAAFHLLPPGDLSETFGVFAPEAPERIPGTADITQVAFLDSQSATPPQTKDNTAAAPQGKPAQPSLQDLGFAPDQANGNAEAQARLDKRSHMLKVHQTLGLITLIPMVATIFAAGGASGHGSVSGRNLHAALGIVTAGMYITTASYAIGAPSVPGMEVRGPIRVHKALGWVHGVGMILTPILGAMARSQLNSGEKVHGIATAHSAVAWVTVAAYSAAIGSVALKF
jgi:hypothetical protein